LIRIDRYSEQVELPLAAIAFLEIDAFVRRFNLEWFVVGTPTRQFGFCRCGSSFRW
jgi:hypothetical protein